MFKNETLVKLAVLVLIVLESPIGSAQTPPASPAAVPQLSDCGVAFSWLNTPNPVLNDDQKEVLKYCKAKLMNESADDICKNSAQDYKKAISDLAGACGGFSTASEDNGNVACSHAIEKCDCFNPSQSGYAARPLCQSNGISLSASPSTEERFKLCPAEAGRDLDKLDSDTKEQRKLVSELNKRVAEANKGVAQARRAGRDKMAQIRDQMAQEAERQADKIREARRTAEQERNQLRQQAFDIQQQIANIEERRSQVNNVRGEIDRNYWDQVAKIDLDCHASALAEVSKLQDIEVAKLKVNIRNWGGFGDMMKNVGVTERQLWQKKAAEIYHRCLIDDAATKAKTSAANAREKAFKAQDRAEAKVDADRLIQEQKLVRIRNGSSCASSQAGTNGDTTESSMCEARRKAVEDAAQAAQIGALKRNNLRKSYDDAAAEAAGAGTPESEAVSQAAGELAGEQNRLRELEALLALKKQYAGNSKMDEKQFNEARGKNAALKMAARSFVGCAFTKVSPSGTTNPATARCGTECLAAANFLRSVGVYSTDTYNKIKGDARSPMTQQDIDELHTNR